MQKTIQVQSAFSLKSVEIMPKCYLNKIEHTDKHMEFYLNIQQKHVFFSTENLSSFELDSFDALHDFQDIIQDGEVIYPTYSVTCEIQKKTIGVPSFIKKGLIALFQNSTDFDEQAMYQCLVNDGLKKPINNPEHDFQLSDFTVPITFENIDYLIHPDYMTVYQKGDILIDESFQPIVYIGMISFNGNIKTHPDYLKLHDFLIDYYQKNLGKTWLHTEDMDCGNSVAQYLAPERIWEMTDEASECEGWTYTVQSFDNSYQMVFDMFHSLNIDISPYVNANKNEKFSFLPSKAAFVFQHPELCDLIFSAGCLKDNQSHLAHVMNENSIFDNEEKVHDYLKKYVFSHNLHESLSQKDFSNAKKIKL